MCATQPNTTRIKIANPPLDSELRTYMTADSSAAATTLYTLDNKGFVLSGDIDYYIMVGEYGTEKSEILLVDASDAATAETSFKTGTTVFSHEASDPVTYMRYNQIKIYGGTTSGFTPSIDSPIETINIDTTENFTEYTYTGSTYSYFKIAYYNSNLTTISGYSDEIMATSYNRNSIRRVIESGLRKAMTSIDENPNSNLNWDIAVEIVQDGIDEILARKRKWSFLRTTDSSTSTVASTAYTTIPSDLLALEFIKVDDVKLDYISRNDYNNYTASGDTASSGRPVLYTIMNNRYYFYPVPDASYTITYEYYSTIADITSDLSTDIDYTFVPILIYYCGAQFAYLRGNDTRGDKLYQMFMKLLEDQVVEYSGPEQFGEAEGIVNTSIYGDFTNVDID